MFLFSSGYILAACWILAPPSEQGTPASQALFAFAWISDMHLDETRRDPIARALRFIDEELKPDFVLITGDNNSIPAPGADPAHPEPVPLRRQRFLKEFLAKHLHVPTVVLPGDNWPESFEAVFGASQFSFDYGGLHFLMLAPDRSCRARGMEGLSVFDGATWEWIRKDLEACRGKPAIVAIHEPFYPPTFLDARPLHDLIRRHPQVIGALQGHLHVDMDFRDDGRAYLVAPSLGKSRPPSFKIARVHAEAIRLETFRHDDAADRFKSDGRRQEILIPSGLRKGLMRPAGGFTRAADSCIPPHPHVDDPLLLARRGELLRAMRDFLLGRLRIGMGAQGKPE